MHRGRVRAKRGGTRVCDRWPLRFRAVPGRAASQGIETELAGEAIRATNRPLQHRYRSADGSTLGSVGVASA